MADVTIYHNPKCSKSRQTLALLKEQDKEPTIVEYLKKPPSESDLKRILGQLGIEPSQLIRKKEWKEDVGQDIKTMGGDEIVKQMAAHPRVIERPIVISGDQARLGRPPEQVLEIL